MKSHGIQSCLGFFFCFFQLQTAFADWTSISPRDFNLESPPAPSSLRDKKDFEELHQYQETRSAQDCAFAQAQKIPSIDGFFGASSHLFSATELEAFRPLISEVFDFSDKVSSYFKGKYLRPRPYNEDPTINPCIDRPGGNKSYPSGHATLASASACVLAKIYPERSRAILEYGRYLGDLRYIVGVHHPSDVEAGQNLAEQICKRIFEEPDFKKAVENARP